MASEDAKAKPGGDQSAVDKKETDAAPNGNESAENQSGEPKNNPGQSYWRKCLAEHTALEYFNGLILFFTFVAAAFAAVYAANVANLTGDLARDSAANLDSSTRAYIAVTGVKWDGAPEVGKNQRIKILFKNVGKEAAADFSLFAIVSNQFDFEPDSKGMPHVSPDKVQWPPAWQCRVPLGTRIIGSRPVYPDVTNEAIWYAFNPGGSTPGAVFVPQRLIEGRTTFWVAGCAVYQSLGKPRQSPFCFYYQPARGKGPEDGTFEWCPVGAGNAD